MNYVRGDGSPFTSSGECVSYAAHGSAFTQVALHATFTPDPTRTAGDVEFEDVTITGSGLEPGSTVTYSFVPFGTSTPIAPQPVPNNSTVAADGTFRGGWQTGCPLDSSFVFYATTAYGQPITATGC